LDYLVHTDYPGCTIDKRTSTGKTQTEEKCTRCTLRQVVPVQSHGNILQVFTYKRIKTEELSQEMIKRIYELQNAKSIVVLECPNYFLIQYPNRPFVFLNKQDGKLYVLDNDGYNDEAKEHQASFVVRMLNKFGYVENLHSKKIGRKNMNKEKQVFISEVTSKEEVV